VLRTLFLLTCLALFAGCGDTNSRVKGELIENGQPASFPPGAMAGVVLRPLDAQNRPSETTAYKAVVTPAGSFEWVGGNGELPTGGYQFSLELTGSIRDKYQHLTPAVSRKRIDLKPGANLLTIDIGSKD
jgi:hypothetical protein